MPSSTSTSFLLTQALLHWVLPLSLSTSVYFLLYYTKLLSVFNGSSFLLGGAGSWFGAFAFFIVLSLVCYAIVQNMRIHQWFKYLPRAPGQETCLITGATQGIGFAIAKLFARDGFNLILVARSIEELEETQRVLHASYPRIGIELCQADLYLEDSPELIMRQVDRIIAQRHPMWILTHLVNNAGICLRGDFIDLTMQDQLALIQLDTTNVMKMCHMVCNKWRNEYMQRNLNLEFRVMNISSFAGVLVSPFMATYTGCKAFVHNFTMALHDELYSRFNGRITCTSVCPGYTLTPGIYKMQLHHSVAHEMNLFEDVDKVAREAYYATMNGHRYTITGWTNYIMGLMSYILPVWVSSKFIRLTNADVNSIGEAWRTGGPVYVEKMHATVVPLQSKA